MPELPEELVERVVAVWKDDHSTDVRALARKTLDAIDLSSILRERAGCVDCEACNAASRARLEAAEGELDAAKAELHEEQQLVWKASDEIDRLRGERDRLREALAEAAIPLEVLHGQIPYFRATLTARKLKAFSPELQAAIADAVKAIRAALSTGDRQEQHLGGTGARVLPESHDGHETEAGSS